MFSQMALFDSRNHIKLDLCLEHCLFTVRRKFLSVSVILSKVKT